MAMILAIPGQPVVYPATVQDVRLAYPSLALFNKDFSSPNTPGSVIPYASLFFFSVAPATQPSFNPVTHELVDGVTGSGSTWTQEWSVVTRATPGPQWIDFAIALATEEALNDFIGGLAPAHSILQLMLGVGMGQASEGRPATFLAAWTSALPLAPEGLAESVSDLAEGYNLPAEFIAAINPP